MGILLHPIKKEGYDNDRKIFTYYRFDSFAIFAPFAKLLNSLIIEV